MTSEYPSIIAYAVILRFWRLLIDSGRIHDDEETLYVITCSGMLDPADLNSFDRSYMDDWKTITRAANSLTADQTYEAMLAWMRMYADIGVSKDFKDAISRLDEDRVAFFALWQNAVAEIDTAIAAGDPLRTAIARKQ